MHAEKENIQVPDATFIKDDEKQIEFNLITIQELNTWKVDHSIERPHRLSFNAIMIILKGKGMHIIKLL